MSENWQPGDLAKCIDEHFDNLSEGTGPVSGPQPKLGCEYLVTGTEQEMIQGHLLTGLFLAGFPRTDSWYEAHFVKAKPRGQDRKRQEAKPFTFHMPAPFRFKEPV